MQCGRSDGYPGITANPVLGAATDMLVTHSGRMMLSKTSEIYRAEQLLTQRTFSADLGEKLLDRICWWEDYTVRKKGEMDNTHPPATNAAGRRPFWKSRFARWQRTGQPR